MKKFACPLRRNAVEYPQQPALITPQLCLNFLQFDQAVTQTVLALKRLGIKKSSVVGILAKNNIHYVVLLWALWRIQAIAVLFSPRLPSIKIKEQLKILRVKHLFVDRELKGHQVTSHKVTGDLVTCDVVTTSLSHPASDIFYSSAQPSNIIFTAGSTAEPKAAVLTLGNHFHNALGANENMPLGKNDRWLLSLPLYHVGGLAIIFRTVMAGASMILPGETTNLSSTIKRYQITHLSLVPTQLYRLLKEAKGNLKSLKAILLGGAPIPGRLLAEAIKRKLPIYITYGLTEMGSQVATSAKITTRNLSRNAAVLRYRRVKIARDGEILVKGPTLFKGYSNGRNIRRPSREGDWFPTGDLGELSKDGVLRVTGRKDNMFISGGENIQPEEIEKYLLDIPDVEQAVVIGQPDAEFGFRPAVFIQGKNKKWLPKYLIDKLQIYLPKYKIPVVFYPWPKHVSKSGLKVSRGFFRGLLK